MLFLKIELQITNRRCNFPEKKKHGKKLAWTSIICKNQVMFIALTII